MLQCHCYANITGYTFLKQTETDYLRPCENLGFTSVGEDVCPFRAGLFMGFHLLGFTVSVHTKSETSTNCGSFASLEVKSRNN